jgi:hypothetical protein
VDNDASLARLRKQRDYIDHAIRALERLLELNDRPNRQSTAPGSTRKVLRLPQPGIRRNAAPDDILRKRFG